MTQPTSNYAPRHRIDADSDLAAYLRARIPRLAALSDDYTPRHRADEEAHK